MNLRLLFHQREPVPSTKIQRYEYLTGLWKAAGIPAVPLRELDPEVREDALFFCAPVLSAVRPVRYAARVYADQDLVQRFERSSLESISRISSLYDVREIVRRCDQSRIVRDLDWFDSAKAWHNDGRIETIVRQLETVKDGPAAIDFTQFVTDGQVPYAQFDAKKRELVYTIRPRGLCVIS